MGDNWTQDCPIKSLHSCLLLQDHPKYQYRPEPLHSRGLCILVCAHGSNTSTGSVYRGEILQYFTRQHATPGNVPLALATIRAMYNVHSIFYILIIFSGRSNEASSLMWPVEVE